MARDLRVPLPRRVVAAAKVNKDGGTSIVMGELIHLQEIDHERRRSRARIAERVHLERAVAILRENLAAAAEELRDAPAGAQAELLGQIEKLAAMVRYGLRMLGETIDGDVRVRRGADPE